MTTTWRNSRELNEFISDWPEERIEKLISARQLAAFIHGAIFTARAEEFSNIVETIKPSAHAEEIISLDKGLAEIDDVTLRFASLLSLFHNEILIDLDYFDSEQLALSLSGHLKNRTLILAPRFGRFLYDKFSKQYMSDRLDSLDSVQTRDLLSEVEQGVYQVGQYVSGPLGIIESLENRSARPSRRVPLWHCDNLGCNHLHEVLLSDHDAIVRDAADRIDAVAQNFLGPHSHWGVIMSNYVEDDYSIYFRDFIALLQDCFNDQETRIIFEYCLKNSTQKSHMWDCIRSNKIDKIHKSTPENLASSLDLETIRQIVLIQDNEEIVRLIDQIIWYGLIVIPSAEVRKPKQSSAFISSSISSLGIRADVPSPSARLALEVWDAYDEADRLPDLSWRTVKRAGPAVPGDVSDYLNKYHPKEAVRQLVLGSRDVLESICTSISIEMPVDASDDLFVDRMLWKFGYSFPRFGMEYSNLIKHLDRFKEAVLRCSDPLTNDQREQIRSAGVNLFVNLEWFIEIFVSFNVWFLHNDHLLSNFIYDQSASISIVSDVMPKSDFSPWDPRGGNTLGVLLEYLSISVGWIKGLTDYERADNRSPDEYPHYTSADSDIFPFHKKQFWANLDSDELRRYTLDYEDVVSLILKSDLASIRNGLDHFRRPEEFPALDAMLACESRIRQAVEVADLKRIWPKRWWLEGRNTRNSGQITQTFVDERADNYVANYPSVLLALPECDYGQPVVLAYGNLLGQANSTILFFAMDNSDYVDMWKDYPARPAEISKKLEPSPEEPVETPLDL